MRTIRTLLHLMKYREVFGKFLCSVRTKHKNSISFHHSILLSPLESKFPSFSRKSGKQL